jgi:hypothetical protein
LPGEISWYQRRLANGWQYLAFAVALSSFAAPFFLLLARDLKRSARRLAAVTMLLVAAYVLNMYWTIVPAFPASGFVTHVANGAALMAIGGLFLAFYVWQVTRLNANRTANQVS